MGTAAYKYRDYTDEDIRKYAAEVLSMRQLLVKLGKSPNGGNHGTINRRIAALGIDTSHWLRQGIRVGPQKDLNDYAHAASVKPHLIAERGHQCEIPECGISDWLGAELMLEIDHIDGDPTNNHTSNLRLICPNCHSQTPTFRNRKRV